MPGEWQARLPVSRHSCRNLGDINAAVRYALAARDRLYRDIHVAIWATYMSPYDMH